MFDEDDSYLVMLLLQLLPVAPADADVGRLNKLGTDSLIGGHSVVAALVAAVELEEFGIGEATYDFVGDNRRLLQPPPHSLDDGGQLQRLQLGDWLCGGCGGAVVVKQADDEAPRLQLLLAGDIGSNDGDDVVVAVMYVDYGAGEEVAGCAVAAEVVAVAEAIVVAAVVGDDDGYDDDCC